MPFDQHLAQRTLRTPSSVPVEEILKVSWLGLAWAYFPNACRRFLKVDPNGAYEVTAGQRKLPGFLEFCLGGACFGFPIGVRFEKHRASTSKCQS